MYGGTHPPAGTPPAPGPLRQPSPSTPAPTPQLAPPAPAGPTSFPAPVPSRSPSPRAAVAEAFAHFARRKRISRQMVVMFIESKYPELAILDRQLDRLIAGERRQRSWAQQVEQLRTLRPGKLKRLSRMVDRVLAEGPDGPQGAQLAWAMALAPHVAAELERRAELRDALDPQRRRRERQEYMALAEREFRRQEAEGRRPQGRAAPPQAGAAGGVCSPQYAPTQHELFSCGTETQASGTAGLVARLERLKQEQGGVGKEGEWTVAQ